MSGYQSYPEYRDSGIEWITEYPTEWKLKKVKYCAHLNPSKIEVRTKPRDLDVTFLPMESIGEDGTIDATASKQIGDVIDGYTYVGEGDVCIAKITPCFENGKGAVAVNLTNKIAFATTEIIPIRPHESTDTKFLYFLLSSAPFRLIAEGSMYGAGGQKRVADTFVANYEFACPSSIEQQQITIFLDHETAKIDNLIEKQKQLIKLLKEKRQAVISHAVTKGLNPDAPMKDSGVEWLGEVPEHWYIMKFGQAAFMQEGPGLRNWQFTNSGVRVICVTNITEEGIDFSRYKKYISKQEYQSAYRHFKVQQGDVLLSSSGNSWGKVASFDGVDTTILNTSTIRLNDSESDQVYKGYIPFLLKSESCREQLGIAMTGACQPNFGPTHLKEVKVAIPPREEQQEIAGILEKKMEGYNNSIYACDNAVALLQERRTALISAAVTGKIDVRNWQPPKPTATTSTDA